MARSSLAALVVLGSLVLAPLEARATETEGGMSSPGAFGVGVFLSAIGAGGVVAGGYFFSQGAGACDGMPRDEAPSDAQIARCTTGVTQQVAGVVGMVTGGAFVLGGIPLMGAGAASDDAPPPVSVAVGPTGASLRVVF